MGISLGDRLNKNKAIKNLGLCFFGIYLIHPLSMNMVKILMARIAPQLTTQVTIISMLVFSLSSFFLSWWAVGILIKNECLARYMFGATSK
jgi:peptidoglycan/LPS O-acetylase OafA/YrhL